MLRTSVLVVLITFAWSLSAKASNATEQEDARQRVLTALDERGDFQFADKELAKVADELSARFKLNVHLDGAELKASGLEDVRLSLDVKRVRLRTALDPMLQPHNLAYLVRDGVLVITTQSGADHFVETRVYPVGDILAPTPSKLRVIIGDGYLDVDSLSEMLRTCVAPNSWWNMDEIAFLDDGRLMVVRQTQNVHYEIQSVLADLRASRRQVDKERRSAGKETDADDGVILKIYRLPVWALGSSNRRSMMGEGLCGNEMFGEGRMGGGIFQVEEKVESENASGSQDECKREIAPDDKTELSLVFGGGATVMDMQYPQAHELAELLPSIIGYDAWNAGGDDVGAYAFQSSLFVRQTPAVHRQVEAALRAYFEH